jgi:hypothetical protein
MKIFNSHEFDPHKKEGPRSYSKDVASPEKNPAPLVTPKNPAGASEIPCVQCRVSILVSLVDNFQDEPFAVGKVRASLREGNSRHLESD